MVVIEDDDPYIDPDDDDDSDSDDSDSTDNSTDDNSSREEEPLPLLPQEGEEHVVCDAVGRLVVATPPDGCTSLHNTNDVRGSIAIVYRGTCSFQLKVLNAEAAGAVGAIVINGLPPRLPATPATTTPATTTPATTTATEEEEDARGGGGDTNEADGEKKQSQEEETVEYVGTLMQMAPETSPITGKPFPQPLIPSVMVTVGGGRVLVAAAEEGRRAKIWDPPLSNKLELARKLIEEERQGPRGDEAGEADSQGSEGNGPKEECAAGEKNGIEGDKGGSREAAGVSPKAKETDKGTRTTKKEQNVVESELHLEVVLPPNSQAWIMHQVYQLKHDLTPAMHTAAQLLHIK